MKTIGNRRIKFKAWILKDKKFFYQDEQYLQSFLKRCTRLSNPTAPSEHEKYGDYILLQSTGLKDKNGKEIWEGDIIVEYWEGLNISPELEELLNPKNVVEDNGNIKCYEIKLDGKFERNYGISVIEFDTENAAFSFGGEFLHDHKKGDIVDIEVLGNVYEDTYLLDS